MICCQFVFEPGEYDEDFYRLDDEIAVYARSLPGFISVHGWFSEDKRYKNAIYFFKDMESVKALAKYPQHLTAKKESSRWYKGYQILISEVTNSYGDGKITYP